MVGIDYRPATAKLYGLSNLSRLYIINATTGAATLVGTLTVALTGTEFGIDFNPMVDRLRVVSDADQNIRVHPDTGALAAIDTPLTFAGGDLHAGANPNCGRLCLHQQFCRRDLDHAVRHRQQLSTFSSCTVHPNGGTLNTVGNLGVDASAVLGFDIEAPIEHRVRGDDRRLASSGLYMINLATGAATLVGGIGGGVQVRGLAVVPYVSSLVGLTTANALIRFDANTPGTIAGGPTPITGLDPGETIARDRLSARDRRLVRPVELEPALHARRGDGRGDAGRGVEPAR